MNIRGIKKIKQSLETIKKELEKKQGQHDIHEYLTSDFLLYITNNEYNSLEKIVENSGLFKTAKEFNKDTAINNKEFDKFIANITNQKVSSFMNLIEQSMIYCFKNPRV